jgi:amino acid adenylation domain-containing protein
MRMKNVEDIYSLSPVQQGILFHTLYAAVPGVYFLQTICTLDGALDADIFRQAWMRVVDRHPVLRTAFVWEGFDEPLQVVRQQVTLPWEYHDWGELSPEAQQERLEAFLSCDRRRGFELSKAPLMRFTLFRLNEERHKLVWSSHHLLLDGWSLPLVLREALTFYEVFYHGEHIDLPRPRPYRDYIAWLQQQDMTEAEAFWKDHLRGFIAPTQLPVQRKSDYRAAGAHSGQPEKPGLPQQVLASLSTSTTTALQDLARNHRLTLNVLVKGAWAVLLSRYSNTEDVLFGATSAGRPVTLSGAESMVGLFISTLPVRLQVLADEPVASWLQGVQRQQIESQKYGYAPLVSVHEWSEMPRGKPMFESLFVFENYPAVSGQHSQDQTLRLCELQGIEETNYPLTVSAAVSDLRLTLRITHDASFDAATVTRMLGHLKRILEDVAAGPEKRLAEISLLTETECHQTLTEWNDNRVEYPRDKCLHEFFETQVERMPDAVAVVFDEQHLSYRELNRRANQLAHHLQEHGVGPDVLVGICLERSLEMVTALLGVLKAGGAYVPLDPDYPRERLAFMLQDAQVGILLTQRRLLPSLPDGAVEVICLNADWDVVAEGSGDSPPADVTPGNPAYVIYTSGSTGRPKGVMITHRAICNHMYWMQAEFPIDGVDAVFQKTPVSFDASVWEFYAPLFAGARMVLAQPGGHKDSVYLVDTIIRQHVTILQLVPTLLRMLVEDPGFAECHSLRRVFCGGEVLPVELAERFTACLAGVSVCNLYGPTEASIDATFYTYQGCEQQHTVSIGRPIANLQAYVLDDGLCPVPIGVPGELYIGGVGLAREYLNRPGLTAEKFVPHPFSSLEEDEGGRRLYKTGDVARRLPDGNLEFLGRVDHQVKVRGFRIELGEIEAVLVQHRKVREAVALAREDAPGDKRLVAYVVAEDGQHPDVREMREYLEERLPGHLVPAAFVTLEVLPLTPNGKVDRRALPAPGVDNLDLTEAFVAPRNDLELELARIWEDVLGVQPVGVTQNFFELGGHSLLAMQLFSRIREAFQVDFPLAVLFEAPTIEAIAEVITQYLIEQADEELVAATLQELR